MFGKRLLATAAVATAAVLGGAGVAIAAPMPVHQGHPHVLPYFQHEDVTEIQSFAYGDSNYVLNNYNGNTGNDNLVSEWNDVGQARTYFTVKQVTTSGGNGVYTFQAPDGAYLSDWDNSNPAVQGWRGRMVYAVNGDVQPSAEWVAVPSAVSGEFYLENFSTVGTTTPLFLTTHTNETDTPAWSDTLLEPGGSATQQAQLFGFIVPKVRPDVTVRQSQSMGTSVTSTSPSKDVNDYSLASLSPANELTYTFDIANRSDADVTGLTVGTAADVTVVVKNGATDVTHSAVVPLTVTPNVSVIGIHGSEVSTAVLSVTNDVSSADGVTPVTATELTTEISTWDGGVAADVVSVQVTETPVVTAGATVVDVFPSTLTANYSA